MKKYKNIEGSLGVICYEEQPDGIVVEFNNENHYLYSYSGTGKSAVEKMKPPANKGKGLNTYISQSVTGKFAKKLN